MTADPRNSATRIALDEVAGEAALIATFYGRREPIPEVHRLLYRSLSRSPEDAPIPDVWRDPDGQAFLHRFDPSSAHDTTVVQLALNSPGGAAGAWETARKRLENLLNAEDLRGAWWGYTLTYQAVLTPDVDADRGFSELLPSIRTLDSTEVLQPLAQGDVAGGKLWLLDVPTRGEGLAAATLYAALGPPEQEEDLVKAVYGPGATLLMPDLIAHKGYYQMRQYRGGDLESRYETSVSGLREATEHLLSALGHRDMEAAARQVNELSRMYHPLVSVASNLEELHVSLIRQSHNYARWQSRIGDDAVVEFHREHLETATLELELKVKELWRALETADKAVSVAQVRTAQSLEARQRGEDERRRQADKEEGYRRRRIDTALAVAAATLALPEMLDREATRALLGSVGVRVESQGDILMLLLTQGFIILTAALLLGLAVYFLSKKWRKWGK
jgi:hypothetical protein